MLGLLASRNAVRWEETMAWTRGKLHVRELERQRRREELAQAMEQVEAKLQRVGQQAQKRAEDDAVRHNAEAEARWREKLGRVERDTERRTRARELRDLEYLRAEIAENRVAAEA